MRPRLELYALILSVLVALGGVAAAWMNLAQRVSVVEVKQDATLEKVDGLRDMLVEAIRTKSMSKR